MTRLIALTVALTVAIVVAASCGGPQPDDQLTGSIDSAAWEEARSLPSGVQEALDRGNELFRERELEGAREQYLRAVELGPEVSAAWFGLSMVERQLGNITAADSAMLRVRDLAPEASLLEPGDSAGGR